MGFVCLDIFSIFVAIVLSGSVGCIGIYIWYQATHFFPYLGKHRLEWIDTKIETPIGLIIACLSSYAFTIYCFAVVYAALSSLDVNSFNIKQSLGLGKAFYYSLITAATVGFGDIASSCAMARTLTAVEIAISYFYTIFIFSAIATIIREKKPKRSNGTQPEREPEA